MNINLNIDTKYNIGDEVYCIEYCYKYNDYYNNEMEWKVVTESDDRTPLLTSISEIQLISTQIRGGSYYNINYKVSDSGYYPEGTVFSSLDDAKAECERRNKLE